MEGCGLLLIRLRQTLFLGYLESEANLETFLTYLKEQVRIDVNILGTGFMRMAIQFLNLYIDTRCLFLTICYKPFRILDEKVHFLL